MSEFEQALEVLAAAIPGLEAAVVLETTGIELAVWGEADFEVVTAEAAELWRAASSAEGLGPGPVEILCGASRSGSWLVLPLAGDYLLAVLAGPDLPLGKARFYAAEWAREHAGDLA